MYISACPALDHIVVYRTMIENELKPVFAYISRDVELKMVKKDRDYYSGAVLMFSPVLSLNKVGEAIKEFADTNPILICPTVAEKLGIDTKGVYMYGSDEFWDFALGELIYFKGGTYKENIQNIIKVLGKGYVGLVRIVASPFLRDFSNTFELYSKCFGLSSDYDEAFSTINEQIIKEIGSKFVEGPHGFEPDYALDIVAKREKFNFLDKVDIDITLKSEDEEWKHNMEYLAKWIPRNIVLQDGKVKIVGLL